MTDKTINLFPSIVTPLGTEEIPVWASPGGVTGTYQMTAAQIASLSKSIIPLELCGAPISTRFDSTKKRICGKIYFDPTNIQWKLSASSTATLRVMLETTNAANSAYIELALETSTSSTSIAILNTASLISAALSVDVSTYFRNSSAPGNFVLRTWINVDNVIDYSTCSGGRVEILP